MTISTRRPSDSPFHHFNNIYRGKRVLVTGHTGFKGSWLTTWLTLLGAEVIGYSSYLPSKPCNFEVCNLRGRIIHIEGDICDISRLAEVFLKYEPDIVFHMAAQALTRRSYEIPQETFFTNLGGTVNILECIRRSETVTAAVIITSDKCYQNVEWVWGYRENDRLGGDDPYSASKACAEIATHAYMKSFFSKDGVAKIATARAGNVIGGGDWAVDRIVPDCARAFSSKDRLEIRSPNATRPWQHVLEPLSGYLWLGANLLNNFSDGVARESFNFGPLGDVNRTVEELIREFNKTWKIGEWYISDKHKTEKKESTLLKLSCDKALHFLDWHATLPFDTTVEMTAKWYQCFYKGQDDMFLLTVNQIEEYTILAHKQGLKWTE